MVGNGEGDDVVRIATSNLITNLKNLIRMSQQSNIVYNCQGCPDLQKALLRGDVPAYKDAVDVGIAYADGNTAEQGKSFQRLLLQSLGRHQR